MNAKHSASRYFLALGLFDGLNSFAELESKISALPGNKECGDLFKRFLVRPIEKDDVIELPDFEILSANQLRQLKHE
ncbi:MAG: hypothetical protein WC736_06280 [Gallionella sp.]|jgi:hypothetical protein